VGLVKVYCVEFCKEFGSASGNDSKNTIYNMFAKKKLISKKNASCLTYIFQIGDEVRESSLVINPIHKHV
jgi:hypothetical protein